MSYESSVVSDVPRWSLVFSCQLVNVRLLCLALYAEAEQSHLDATKLRLWQSHLLAPQQIILYLKYNLFTLNHSLAIKKKEWIIFISRSRSPGGIIVDTQPSSLSHPLWVHPRLWMLYLLGEIFLYQYHYKKKNFHNVVILIHNINNWIVITMVK